MYVIEFHDDDTENEIRGSLGIVVGRNGTVEYAYQVEIWVQEAQDFFPNIQNVTRVYAIHSGKVVAIWQRNITNGELTYLGRSPDYQGEWQLPSVDPDATEIATTCITTQLTTEELVTWAASQFASRPTIACAIALDKEGIVAAWERGLDGPILVARGPQRSSVANV